MSEPYAHPTLTAAYSRDTEDSETIHFFDVGNGYAAQVTQLHAYDLFKCEVYIIPQFPGASVYNSSKTDIMTLMTSDRVEVTKFIDELTEARMLEVDSPDELRREFL